ncbi:Uncharacterised protein [Legionella pneumophila]|nr:Uncharacterised protein [Legionella pneumophila]
MQSRDYCNYLIDIGKLRGQLIRYSLFANAQGIAFSILRVTHQVLVLLFFYREVNIMFYRVGIVEIKMNFFLENISKTH